MIKVLFFGRFSDAAKPMECALPAEVSDIAGLAKSIARENAPFAQLYNGGANRVSLNQRFVEVSAQIKDGDEIAFMSPLSGG